MNHGDNIIALLEEMKKRGIDGAIEFDGNHIYGRFASSKHYLGHCMLFSQNALKYHLNDITLIENELKSRHNAESLSQYKRKLENAGYVVTGPEEEAEHGQT